MLVIYGNVSKYSSFNLVISYLVFIKSNLSYAKAIESNFENCDMSYVFAKSANFNNSNMTNVSLYCSDLNHARLSEVILTNSNLDDANLLNTDFRYSNLSGCNLQTDTSRAWLEGASTRGAILRLTDEIKGYDIPDDCRVDKTISRKNPEPVYAL